MTDEPDDVETLDVQVPPLLDGVRLDRALSMLTGLSRADSASLLGAGLVRLGDVVVQKGSTALREGDRLEAELPKPPIERLAPDPSVEVTIVVVDDAFIVVDKAAGVVVHPGAGHSTATLISGLVARFPDVGALADAPGGDPLRPGIVHRLDKGTSGLLVVARTQGAAASFTAQLADRSMSRGYVGLVEGHVADDHGVIDAPIGRSQRSPTKMAVRSGGREARTHYAVRRRLESPARSLLDVHLESGRTHQIRVHLAAIGRPIVNDPQYGTRREQRLAEGRVFLHAASLGFEHPVSGERVEVASALPDDLAALLD